MRECHCQPVVTDKKPPVTPVGASPTRPAVTFALSFLIAFFPKCPLCWAAYSSWLGLAGIIQIPYMGFIFPVLVTLLVVHLLLLVRHVPHIGWGPLLTCATGATLLMVFRQIAPEAGWALNSGILLMLAGSLWNTFSLRRRRLDKMPNRV